MSIKRTASSSSGPSGSGGGFWTVLAAWSALAVSLANLALLMYLWNRLPVEDLKQELSGVLRRDSQGLVQEERPRPVAVEQAAVPPPAAPTVAASVDSSAARSATAAEGARISQPSPEAARPGIRLQVQNGSGVRLLAARAAESLRRMSYDVRETGTAKEAFEKTQIISRVQDPAPSLRLAQDLGLSSARISYSPDPVLVDVDLTLILGADYQKLPITGNR